MRSGPSSAVQSATAWIGLQGDAGERMALPRPVNGQSGYTINGLAFELRSCAAIFPLSRKNPVTFRFLLGSPSMSFVESLGRESAQAFRTLLREKTFTLTIVVTIGLCLGANIAIFAIVYGLLLKPLPFAEPRQLVAVYNMYPKAGIHHAEASAVQYLERRAQVEAFAEAAAIRNWGATIGDTGATERIDASNVTPSFFKTLQVAPALGRTFAEEEGVYGRDHVIVLSDALWRQRFAADPNIVGKTLRVNSTPYTIIGVMSPDFRYLDTTSKAWTPLCFNDDDRSPRNRHNNNLNLIARLKPGATLAEAKSQIAALNERAMETDPFASMVRDAGFGTEVRDLQDDYVARLRPTLLLLQAGVVVLLLIGSVNVANLLLVRSSGRVKDHSIRQALGASRRQLATHLMIEVILLCALGAGTGIAFGYGLLKAVGIFGVKALPAGIAPTLSFTACAVGICAALAVGLGLGALLVWQAMRENLAGMLAVESRGGTTTRSVHRIRHALVAAQISLAFILLTGAGLLGLSFQRVLATNPGFQPDQTLTAMMTLPWESYKDEKQRAAFAERLGAELRAMPGVSFAGLVSGLPFSGISSNGATVVEGRTPSAGESVAVHYHVKVSGEYFKAIGITLREGRLLEDRDQKTDATTCVIDDTVARHYWPNESALGHRIGPVSAPPNQKFYTIVGVVNSVKQKDLATGNEFGALYLPFAEQPPFAFHVVLRAHQAPEPATAALRAAVLRLDPELPVSDVRLMSERINASLGTRRTPLLLAGMFASIALVLASIGLYGVLSFAVAQRRREIGIRMAIGAQPQHVLAQFLLLGVKLLTIGLILGLVGAYFAGQAMRSTLFGVEPTSALVISTAAAVLGFVAIAACAVPSRRAAMVPPLEALRD